MALSYEQKNPRSILRDFLVDPAPALAEGFAYPAALGLPTAAAGNVATGRSIDLSGTPGVLSGTLLVRSQRDILGASADAQGIAKPVGSPRDLVEGYAMTQINFDLAQFDGMAREKIAHIENGFTDAEERHLAQTAGEMVHQKIEVYATDFFTALAAESATAQTVGGWTELDWQGGTLGGAAIGTSTNAITALHRACMATRLAGASKVNMAIIPQPVFERLQRDAELLGRVVNGNNWAAGSGASVAPPSVAIQVLKDHLEIDEIVIAAGARTTQKRGQSYDPATNNAYIWPVDRMWIGNAGEMDVSVRAGASPRVLNEAGAFGCLYSKVFETDLGFEKKTGPQFLECTVDTFLEMVALSPAKGAIIHNMD